MGRKAQGRRCLPALLVSIFIMQAAVLEGREVLITLARQNYSVSADASLSPSWAVKKSTDRSF